MVGSEHLNFAFKFAENQEIFIFPLAKSTGVLYIENDMTKEEAMTTYDLTIKQAIKLTGKSERTLRRHVKNGRLTVQYVMGQKGREIRLNHAELKAIFGIVQESVESDVMSEDMTEEAKPNSDTGHDQTQAKMPDEYRELLARHEQAMFQLGLLQSKINEVKLIEEKAQSLQERLAQNEQELSEREALIQNLIQEKQQLEDKIRLLDSQQKHKWWQFFKSH